MMTKEQFVKDLEVLVALKTLSENSEENKKAINLIEKKISKKAFVKRFKNREAEVLVASNKKTLKPDVCFLAHVDVVAAKPNQFRLKHQGKFAFGRGVSDMKFSIPIGYYLLNEITDRRLKLSFAFVVTTDEEIGGFDGATFLVEKKKFCPKVLIVPDGGDNSTFVNKSKGVCQVLIESKGVSSHASRPWEGKNAIYPLIKLGNLLIKKYSRNNQKPSWKTTVNIGQIEGGKFVNQVCPEAKMKLDFRFPPEKSAAEIIRETKELAKKIGSNLKVKPISVGFPISTDTGIPEVKLFIRCLEQQMKVKIKIQGGYGSSDARHFSKLGIPVLMIKPKGGGIHSDVEKININSCLDFYQAVRKFTFALDREYVKN